MTTTTGPRRRVPCAQCEKRPAREGRLRGVFCSIQCAIDSAVMNLRPRRPFGTTSEHRPVAYRTGTRAWKTKVWDEARQVWVESFSTYSTRAAAEAALTAGFTFHR